MNDRQSCAIKLLRVSGSDWKVLTWFGSVVGHFMYIGREGTFESQS
jgi:hypothetical protein